MFALLAYERTEPNSPVHSVIKAIDSRLNVVQRIADELFDSGDDYEIIEVETLHDLSDELRIHRGCSNNALIEKLEKANRELRRHFP